MAGVYSSKLGAPHPFLLPFLFSSHLCASSALFLRHKPRYQCCQRCDSHEPICHGEMCAQYNYVPHLEILKYATTYISIGTTEKGAHKKVMAPYTLWSQDVTYCWDFVYLPCQSPHCSYWQNQLTKTIENTMFVAICWFYYTNYCCYSSFLKAFLDLCSSTHICLSFACFLVLPVLESGKNIECCIFTVPENNKV